MADYTPKGWLAYGPEAVEGKMRWEDLKLKNWTEDDVDIEVSHSGICGSELHTLRSGWGPTNYPLCVGHEIVGKAVKVGKNVKHQGIKLGDVVGVGAQADACMECEHCKMGEENHCSAGGMVGTYNAKHKDGSLQQGGYASHARVPGRFCFKIPKEIDPAMAAPMMCGGVTVYTPLVENGCGPGKKVAIIGTGGLGHFGVLFAKALGADKVVAFSRKGDKRPDALKMGADVYVATEEDDGWDDANASSFDLIISTVSSPKMPIDKYLKMLRIRGQFIQVGAPEDVIPGFNMFQLIPKSAKIGGSLIGNRGQIEDMLKLAAKSNVQAWVQKRPMCEANQAVVDMAAGKARYRYVLVN